MRRLSCEIRSDLNARLRSLAGSKPLNWREDCFFELSRSDTAEIVRTLKELYDLCLAAVSHVVERNRFEELGICDEFVPLILSSWNSRLPSFLLKFNFVVESPFNLKLLSINADTHPNFREASVIQWRWKQESFPQAKQYNEMRESIAKFWRDSSFGEMHLVTSALEDEFGSAVRYISDVLKTQGLSACHTGLDRIGWNQSKKHFEDYGGRKIDCLIKQHSWLYLLNDPFGTHLLEESQLVFEPAWKIIMESAGFLALLSELNPNSRFLVRTEWNQFTNARPVKLFPNITQIEGDRFKFGTENVVYQQKTDLDSQQTILNCWMVGGWDAAVSFEEFNSEFKPGKVIPHIVLPN